MGNVLVNENSLQDIASAIREKNGTETTYKPSEMGDAIRGLGGEDLLRLVSKCNFKGLGIFDKEEVVLNLDNVTDMDRMIYCDWNQGEYPNTKVKHLIINCKLPIANARQSFYHPNGYSTTFDTKVERITLNVDFSKATNMANLFANFRGLTIVDGTPIDFSSSTINGEILLQCINVEEIRFVPNSIKVNTGVSYASKLSSESRQSLIDGLADLTGQTQQTITWHTDVFLELTDEQLLSITNKNWEVR